MIEAAEEGVYARIMMPLSLALAERCDAVLRVGGPSSGADQEVQTFRARALPVYLNLDDVPRVTPEG